MATIKQKLALKEIVEKGRSVSGAMRDVGYSAKTAVDPSKLTQSKGFQELIASMDEYSRQKYGLDSHVIATRAYVDGVAATKIITSHTEPDKEVPDHDIRLKAADRVLELQGLKKDPAVNVQNNFFAIAKEQREKYK